MSAGYCRNCGRSINKDRDPYCPACRPDRVGLPSRDMTPFYTPDPEIGLFGGRWVLDPVARVVRWVQEREPSPMTPDLCAVCDVAFQRTNNRQRYCSEPCYKEARRQQGRVNTASYRRRTEGDAA